MTAIQAPEQHRIIGSLPVNLKDTLANKKLCKELGSLSRESLESAYEKVGKQANPTIQTEGTQEHDQLTAIIQLRTQIDIQSARCLKEQNELLKLKLDDDTPASTKKEAKAEHKQALKELRKLHRAVFENMQPHEFIAEPPKGTHAEDAGSNRFRLYFGTKFKSKHLDIGCFRENGKAVFRILDKKGILGTKTVKGQRLIFNSKGQIVNLAINTLGEYRVPDGRNNIFTDQDVSGQHQEPLPKGFQMAQLRELASPIQ